MARILMVDDDLELLTLTKGILQKNGFETEVCSEWKTAWEKIISFDPNLVLLDVFLGANDGLHICQKLKASHYTRDIPVLILSGYPNLADSAILEFGAEDFLAKPFNSSDVVSKVGSILSRNQIRPKIFPFSGSSR